MTPNYPLKFDPIYKEKLWGGDKLRSYLGKDFSPLPSCGESWELSGVEGNISKVANGPLQGKLLSDLLQSNGEDILGQKAFKKFGANFPLLVKFLDANKDLSIQVHPNDELAKTRHNGFGKTEMWYVLQADPNTTLISGFNREMNKESYLQHFKNQTLETTLNREKVYAGDVFFIPAGRVHTIGAGLLIAEIQQTSDITYRIYDFNRVDADGNKRELHVEQAVDAIDYKYYDQYKSPINKTAIGKQEIVRCEYFITNYHHYTDNQETVIHPNGDFRIITVVAGDGNLDYAGGKMATKAGEVWLIPANLDYCRIATKNEISFLETYIELS
ncbi:type I phosphomannose isomerase catalytic subunit [Peijinzhouia sedimentorum]